MRVHTLSRKNEESAKQSFEVWTRVRIKDTLSEDLERPVDIVSRSTLWGGGTSASPGSDASERDKVIE